VLTIAGQRTLEQPPSAAKGATIALSVHSAAFRVRSRCPMASTHRQRANREPCPHLRPAAVLVGAGDPAVSKRRHGEGGRPEGFVAWLASDAGRRVRANDTSAGGILRVLRDHGLHAWLGIRRARRVLPGTAPRVPGSIRSARDGR
jgi:hypothetical protein